MSGAQLLVQITKNSISPKLNIMINNSLKWLMDYFFELIPQ